MQSGKSRSKSSNHSEDVQSDANEEFDASFDSSPVKTSKIHQKFNHRSKEQLEKSSLLFAQKQ